MTVSDVSAGHPGIGLRLGHEEPWHILGIDDYSVAVVARLAELLNLAPLSTPPRRRLLIADRRREHRRFEGRVYSRLLPFFTVPPGNADTEFAPRRLRPFLLESSENVACLLSPDDHAGGLLTGAIRVLYIPIRQSLDRGGILLHGALAVRGDEGVILAGRSGSGKSTVSRRLPPPWQSLGDDLTLVMPDGRGGFLAHPMPTLSQAYDGSAGGPWEIERASALRGIFFLEQNPSDSVKPLGAGEGLCRLTAAAEQVSLPVVRDLPADDVRALRLTIFDNLCRLTAAVPSFHLRHSLDGRFWEEVENALAVVKEASLCPA